MEIDDFGDSEAVLRNRSLLKQTAQTRMAGDGGWDATRPHLEGRLWTRAVLKRPPPGVRSEIEHMGPEYEIQAPKELYPLAASWSGSEVVHVKPQTKQGAFIVLNPSKSRGKTWHVIGLAFLVRLAA